MPPEPLVLARVRVENDDTTIRVAVADINLVGLGVDKNVGRLAEELGAAAALCSPPEVTDLQKEFAGGREL